MLHITKRLDQASADFAEAADQTSGAMALIATVAVLALLVAAAALIVSAKTARSS